MEQQAGAMPKSAAIWMGVVRPTRWWKVNLRGRRMGVSEETIQIGSDCHR